MKNFLTWLSSNKYLGSHLDIRARIFNLLDFGGMFLGVTVGLSCIFLTDAGWLQAGLNFAAALLAVFMLWYADHSGRYRFCYTLTVVVVFIVAFPILFFTGGGYHSGMPSYFVFAIVFTVLILEGKRLIALAGLEAAIYIACFIIAYRYPETVVPFRAEFDTAMDIFVGFAGAGFALTAVMLLHLQFYRDYNAMLDEKAEILEQTNKMKSEFDALAVF